MPIQRKQQVLAKIEISEGVSSSPGANDAVQIFDPQISDDIEVQDRAPAGPTLSRDFAPIGRQTRQITFKTDFRGSGDTNPAGGITEPEFARFLKSTGWKLGNLLNVTISSAITGTGFQVGEALVDGSNMGIIVGILVGGVPVYRTTTNPSTLVVAMVNGTYGATPLAVAGASSLSGSTASAIAAYDGRCYQPTSQKITRIQTAAWSGGTPAAVGETLRVENPVGVIVGAAQLIVGSGGFTDIQVTMLFGTVANGYTLRNAAGTGTAVINVDPEQILTPSTTINHNLDGWRRDLLGGRGDFSLEGESGQPMQFSWTFTGDLGPTQDQAQISTSGLSSIRPPRLLGALCVYGLGGDAVRLPTKRISLANGGTVSPNLDANRAGGSTGSNVTDRDMAISVTVDAVNGGFDWEKAMRDSVPVRAAFVLGTVLGNVLSIVGPQCQVTEVTPGDADGIATLDITLRPRRIFESGDDELYITQM